MENDNSRLGETLAEAITKYERLAKQNESLREHWWTRLGSRFRLIP